MDDETPGMDRRAGCWDLACARLATERPRYPPGTRHGYHGITYGFLGGKVIQRVRA